LTWAITINNPFGAIPYELSKLPMIVRLCLGNNHLTNPEYGYHLCRVWSLSLFYS
jgi:hypothetical protein